MSDLPKKVDIQEEGPREGFQIEPGPISTERKIELIDALSETGLKKIQVASFVNPKRVPGWADADAVIDGFAAKEGIVYHALWLNEKGIERAMQHSDKLTHMGSISTTASETFMKHNTNRGFEINREVQRGQLKLYKKYGIEVRRASLMTAFGCNFEGSVAPGTAVERLREILDIAAEEGTDIEILSLADTMGWACTERHQGSRRQGSRDLARQAYLPAFARYAGYGSCERLCRNGNGRRPFRQFGRRPRRLSVRSIEGRCRQRLH